MVGAASLSPELRELLFRVASHPHGLGFLHLAELECVAITLEVHPRHVVRARELLETDPGRAQIIDEVRRAKERLRGGEAPRPPSIPQRTGARSVPLTDPHELIEQAKRHPLGLRFLLRAPFETVAVTFHVCPSVVFRAREILQCREAGSGSRSGPEL